MEKCFLEIDALQEYVIKEEPTVNKLLRSGEEQVAGLFDGLMTTLDSPKALFRWLPNQYMYVIDNNLYQDKAYYSCSSRFDSFVGHVNSDDLACLWIKTGDTFQGINVNILLPDYNNEGEYILPRGHTFRVNNSTYFAQNEFNKLLLKVGSDERPNTFFDLYHIKSITLYEMDYWQI